MRKLFEGVWELNKKIVTKNLVKGEKVYGETLIEAKGTEYRVWVPFRSKLAAAIKNGLRSLPAKKKTSVLYLGCAEGTTCSHLSDICVNGIIFGVDVSARSMREFVELCNKRKNLVPILANANKPQEYSEHVGKVDLLYQDIAQKNQADIFQKNAGMFLKKNGFGMLCIKARSISSTSNAKKLVEEELAKLKGFKLIQLVFLEPFEKEHGFALVKKL